jgi:peptidoglycan-associated lipoprotein
MSGGPAMNLAALTGYRSRGGTSFVRYFILPITIGDPPMRRPSAIPAALLACAAVFAACSKPAPPPAPVAPPVNQDSINRARARQDSIDAAERARRDSIAAAERAAADAAARRERMAAMMATARNTLMAPVYFDFDKSDLTVAGKAALDAKLPLLNANASLRFRIAGNTDSRGSDEYNLALGQRRAAAAKRYLTDHGIDASRIDLISYGEERPAMQGDTEDAWSKNRRDEFEITTGLDNLKLPNM